MINGRNTFGGIVVGLFVGIAMVIGRPSHADTNTINVTVEKEKGIGVGFGRIPKGESDLTINLKAPANLYILWSERRDPEGDKLWEPPRNDTKAQTHTYIVEGVTGDDGHAVGFKGEVTDDEEREADDASKLPRFDVAVADLHIDLPGVEDETEADETGGLLLPPNAEVTLDVELRAKWANLDGGPEPVHLGQLEFTVTGTGAAEIEIYDPDGTKLYPVEGTSRRVDIPPEDKHYQEKYTIKTTAAFAGSATIEAVFTWDGAIKAPKHYTAKDVVRIGAIEFMININTHNKPKNEHGIPVVSTPADIDEADIPRKMSPGGYIWVNDDNDNPANPTTIDKDDFSVYEDNDLEPFTYTISQAVWEYGYTVEVVVESSLLEPEHIRAWQGNKSHELSSGQYSSLAALDFEAEANAESGVLYIEGLKRGSATIWFHLKNGNTDLFQDHIRITVFAVRDVTWRSFAPGSGTLIQHVPFPAPQGQSRDGDVVFPDRTHPEDVVVRDTPGVRVTFYPSLPEGGLDWELPVYVRVFDVDHYHNDPDFNPNGAGTPNDNQSPYTQYILEQDSGGVLLPSQGLGNIRHIALEVDESSVTHLIVNGTDDSDLADELPTRCLHDIQWADVARLEPDSLGSPVADAVVRLLHHVPGNNWRIAAGCGDTFVDAVQVQTDPGAGQGVAIEYVDGTPLSILQSPGSASKSSKTLTVWRRVYVQLAHMAEVNLTQGPVNVRSVQWGNVTAKDGSILTTNIDTPFGFAHQYAYETRGIARCYYLDQHGNFNYRGKRSIRENEHGANIRILLNADPHFETNYVVIYDDDVDPDSVSAWQDPHPVPQAKIQPRYPRHEHLFDPDYLPAACVAPVLRLRATDRPFRLNVASGTEVDTIAEAKSLQGGERYWVVMALGAYQPEYERSGDGFGPLGLFHLMGQAAAFYTARGAGNARGGSIVYTETIRDYASYVAPRAGQVGQPGWTPDDMERSTVAHEIAHLFGARHGDGGCMDLVQHNGSDPVYILGHGYSGTTLRRIMLIHTGGPDQPAP